MKEVVNENTALKKQYSKEHQELLMQQSEVVEMDQAVDNSLLSHSYELASYDHYAYIQILSEIEAQSPQLQSEPAEESSPIALEFVEPSFLPINQTIQVRSEGLNPSEQIEISENAELNPAQPFVQTPKVEMVLPTDQTSFIGFEYSIPSVLDGVSGSESFVLDLSQSHAQILADSLLPDEIVALPWNFIFGTPGTDTLVGTDGRDYILGYEDNDTIHAGLANDFVEGGLGDDRIFGQDGNDILFGQQGNDWIYGDKGDDSLFGGAGNDILYDFSLDGDNGNNYLDGGIGNDFVIVSGSGNSELHGGEGRDFLYAVGSGNNELFGGEGNDSLYALGTGQNHLFGGEGNDFLYSWNSASVTMEGGIGDDRIYGGNQADILLGQEGNDIIYARNGDDTLFGGDGFDTLRAGNGNDTLSGGAGNDTLYGEAGNDIFLFGAGDGQDTMHGGTGHWVDSVHLDIAVQSVSQLSANQWVLHSLEGDVTLTADEHFDALTQTFADSASGQIEFADGSQANFNDIESLEWKL